jgi:YD repeat-containing protein
MSSPKIRTAHLVAADGTPVRLVYDQEGDILEIFFGANEPATGAELTDHIVLRLNKETKRQLV